MNGMKRMQSMRMFLATGAALALLASAAQAQEASPAAAGAEAVTLPSDMLAEGHERFDTLQTYCTECHNFEDWAGGVAFDTMAVDKVPADAEIWEEVVSRLRGNLMPPPGEPRPSAEEKDQFIAWMEGALDYAGERAPNPGAVALHRLNRTEYGNAIRDLLALDVNVEELLPKDDISHGFDNIANVLQVSPSFLDQYITAADIVAGEAVGEPRPAASGATYFFSGGPQHFHSEGLPLGTRGGGSVVHNFPADGDYVLNLNDMATGGYVVGMEFEQTLIVTLDGVKIYETHIGGEDDLKAIDQLQAPAITEINARLKNIRFRTTAGPHALAAAFVARSFAESDANLHSYTPGGGQDRVLAVTSFDIRGPFDPSGLSETPSRQAIFTCYPADASQEDACAEQILTGLAERAFRRPVTDEDLVGVRRLYAHEKERAGFEAGIRGGLTAILASPNFLYRSDTAPEGLKPGDIYQLSDFELASRLSFFLWSSVPDEELLDVAAAGGLGDKATLEAQVRRMLADPRSESLTTNFAFQWLRLHAMDTMTPDPSIFPYYDTSLRDAFREEMRLFIDSIFREDQSVLGLMNANYTFVNERLALHYGINDIRGDRFRRVELADPNRWGILGKGAVLMGTSYPNRTTPVLRGAYILEAVTGTPPSPPPPGVQPFAEVQDGQVATTVRQRLQQHRTDPVCASCHGVMDPLGLALENFDAVGQWRERDRFAGETIDATAEMSDGTVMRTPAELREALTRHPDQFVQTMVSNMLMFALGREVEYYDMPAVRQIVRDAADDDYRFSAIVMGVIESAPFQMRRVPGNEGEVEEAALQVPAPIQASSAAP
jgi:mono/diheme cytochrome c family protein